MKTAKTQTSPNSAVISGPKFCEGDYTTPSPGGDPDSMRVGGSNTIGNCLEITVCSGDVLQPVRLERPGPEPLEGRECVQGDPPGDA